MNLTTNLSNGCHTLYQEFALGFGYETNRRIAAVVFGIYSPIIVFFNSILFTSFFFTRQVWLNTSNFLIVCLSFSDAINGILVLPLHVFFFLKFEESTPNYCAWAIALQSLMVIFYELSAWIAFLITVDRYLHMNPDLERPSRVARLFVRPYIYVLLAAAFTFSSSHAALYAIMFNSNRSDPNVALQVTVLIILLVLSTTAFLYVRGYRRIQRFALDSVIYRAENGKPRYLQKLYKTVLILLILLYVSYVPLCLSNMAVVLQTLLFGNFSLDTGKFVLASIINMYVTCLLNSVVVLSLNTKAQRFIMNQCRSRKTSTVSFSNVLLNEARNDVNCKRSAKEEKASTDL